MDGVVSVARFETQSPQLQRTTRELTHHFGALDFLKSLNGAGQPTDPLSVDEFDKFFVDLNEKQSSSTSSLRAAPDAPPPATPERFAVVLSNLFDHRMVEGTRTQTVRCAVTVFETEQCTVCIGPADRTHVGKTSVSSKVAASVRNATAGENAFQCSAVRWESHTDTCERASNRIFQWRI